MTVPTTLAELREAYRSGRLRPSDVVAELLARAARTEDHAVWIHRLDEGRCHPYVDRLADLEIEDASLWGVPFAIKDNIDLAGVPTTAGCPGFAYTPECSATVVARLIGAGAIPLGKTNMDQFATGLVGTRSPYGAVRNAVCADHIAGGSSSGSAVAVRLGLASFALGTDTAGSGRIPAAFNDLVGFKPTRGAWSARGVVPACRTLDCVSVFTRCVADARAVAQVALAFDAKDPFSRDVPQRDFDPANVRFGGFDPATLPEVDEGFRHRYADFLAELPGRPRIVDATPFLAAGELLYDGPWIAERYAAIGAFLETNPEAVHPLTRTVIAHGAEPSAVDCFRAQYRLAALKREVDGTFADLDVLVMPTAPRIYSCQQVERDPLTTNTKLGTFTNSVNLLDLCAIAIPAGSTPAGLPFGVTLASPAGFDFALLNTAARLLGEPVNVPT